MITVQVEGYEKLLGLHGKSLIEKTFAVSLQRGLKKTKTHIGRKVREKYVIKQGEINKAFQSKAFRVSYSPPVYQLYWKVNKGNPLRHFGARRKVVRTAKGRRIGVSVRVRRDRGRKLVRGGFYGPHGLPVFMRKGKGRTPIEKKYGLVVTQMLRTRYIDREIDKFLNKEVPKQFHHNLEYFLKKQAGMK